jgi:replicative DNA helicase
MITDPQYRLIEAAVRALQHEGASVDRVTVANELTREGKLQAAGGLTALCELDDGPCTFEDWLPPNSG